MKFWLFKTDPDDFSLNDLKKSPGRKTNWSGVRNFQVRNYLRDEIQKGDEVIFYLSNANPPAAIALCEVVKEGYADHTQFDKNDSHYYPSAVPENPVWYQVDIKLKKEFTNPVTLPRLRENKKLKNMIILKPGNRLSITPVTEAEMAEIIRMSENK